jgi:hypothetical protein
MRVVKIDNAFNNADIKQHPKHNVLELIIYCVMMDHSRNSKPRKDTRF